MPALGVGIVELLVINLNLNKTSSTISRAGLSFMET